MNGDSDDLNKTSQKRVKKIVYPDSLGYISFSGYKWIAKKHNHAHLFSELCASDPENIYVDDSNILNLIVCKKKAKISGIILEMDTTLGYGVYEVDIISNINKIDPLTEFRFSLLCVDKDQQETISEVGMRFTNPENDSAENPLQYYIYTTSDKVPYEFYYDKKYPDISLTRHIIEIDKEFIRLASFEGFLDYQSSEFFEYIFDFAESDVDYHIPSKIKIRLTYCFKNDLIDLDTSNKRTFEIFGIDFVVSEKYYSQY